MKSKVALVLMMIVSLVFVGAAWMHKPRAGGLFASFMQESIPIPVNIKQLPVDSSTNILPVEILDPIAISNGKNRLEQFSCLVRNNTDKGLNATVLAIKILFEDGGVEDSVTRLLTKDTLVHPDMREERGMKDLAPGFSYRLQLPGPSTSPKESVHIKSVSVEIRCALFADDTVMGNDPKGESVARVRRTREGASKYKEWLKNRHSTEKISPDNMIKMIEQFDALSLPENVRDDKYYKEGANMYRRWLLNVYNTKGANAVATYIDKKP